MKVHKFFLLCLLVLSAFNIHAESFSEFNTKITTEENIEKLNFYVGQELRKYKDTKDIYYLYNSKFAEFFIAARANKNNKCLKILSWIIEDGQNANSEQLSWVNYHMAAILTVLDAPKISLEYSLNALKIALKRNDPLLLPIIYSSIGSSYYKQNIFSNALLNYQKAFDYFPENDLLSKASMLNNMALCYMNLFDNIKAHQFFQNSLKTLNRIKQKKLSERTFEIVVIGNIGSILHKLGHYDESILLLEKEVAYYFKDKNNLDLAIPPVIELLKLYQHQKNQEKIDATVSKIVYLEKIVGKNSQFPFLTEALYLYYLNNGFSEKALFFSKRLFEKLNSYSNWNIRQSNELNEILYRDKLIHLKKDTKAQKIILKSAIEDKKKSQLISFIVIVIGILLSAFTLLVYISIKKNSLKNSLIQKQKQEIELNKNMILQNEIRLNQDKIANLAMNLTLKKETEKAFLTKINELKRKKNIDTEQILKDLQLSVSNLLSIDKKMIHTDIETDEVNKKFKIILLSLHPGLSKADLKYCCYFRLNLSAKEIGSIQGISDVSVRVIKNRIKNKLALHADISLNDYLNGLSMQ